MQEWPLLCAAWIQNRFKRSHTNHLKYSGIRIRGSLDRCWNSRPYLGLVSLGSGPLEIPKGVAAPPVRR